jgi:hypothetical protein
MTTGLGEERMRNYLLTGVAAVALSGFVAAQANATAVTTGVWYEFGFGTDSGSPLTGCAGLGCVPAVNAPGGAPIVLVGSPAWTITSTTPLRLTVQDLFEPIDQYQMFNQGASLGLTSVPSNNPDLTCSNDIIACIASPGNSHGTFILAAGADSLTGDRLCTTNCVAGAAVFELDPVPAPKLSPLPVLGAVVLGVAFKLLGWVRRRDVNPDAVA